MIILVLGGTRSGKSVVAEGMAARLAGPDGSVTYLATAHPDRDDADHVARIDAHRARRPASWTPWSAPTRPSSPGPCGTDGVVLVDSLGTWVTGHRALDADPGPLVDALRARSAATVLVSEEVGLAPHAPTELGRRFADALGEVNQAVAAVADHALLVVAGRAASCCRAPGDLPC